MDQFNGNDGEDWMATYADAITLLMAFFVLLYSMSTIDAQKYQVLRYSLSQHLGQRSEVADYEGVPKDLETDAASENKPRPAGGGRASKEDEALAAALESTLIALLSHGGDVRTTNAGITLEFPGDVVYESGSADLREEARIALNGAVRAFNVRRSAGMMVTIEGHTDNQPISTGQFASNWDLAAVRASRIADFFVSAGVDRVRVRSISYGDTRPKASNDTPEGRASNRRVTIRFQRPELVDWRVDGAPDLNWPGGSEAR